MEWILWGFCLLTLTLQAWVEVKGWGGVQRRQGESGQMPHERGSLSHSWKEKVSLTYSADGLSCYEVPGTQHILMQRILTAAGVWLLEIYFTDVVVYDADLSFLQL